MINATEYIRLMAFLKRFDCNNREAAAYIECLRLGPASVQEIAKHLNSNRVTIHSTIEQLIKKGLLFETRKGKKRFIVAETPDVLYRILQRRSNELKLIETDLGNMAKLLYSLQSQRETAWNVRLYEGPEGFKKILEETLMSKNELCVFSSEEFFPEFITASYLRNYYNRLIENNVPSRIISSARYTEVFRGDHPQSQFQIRSFVFPPDCKSAFYVWNDTIALKSFKDERIVCAVIQNKDLAFFFRQVIFENMWRLSTTQL